MPEGLWRDECWFEMAELTARKDVERAIAMCDRAVAFRQDCRQHLWQSKLKRTVDKLGPDHLAEGIAKAERMHDRWAGLLGAGDDFGFRFWRRYYQAALGSMRPLDLAVCGELPDLHSERCLEAGVASWTAHTEVVTRSISGELLLCEPGSGADVLARLASLGPETECVPHPRLEQAAVELRADSCPGLEGF